ncbi:phosphonate C-P lyase system protein PhnL [Thermocrinis sp.]
MLKVERLLKRFEIKVLKEKSIMGCQEVSFEVRRGEFLALFGPSGSGKSTVLKCIYRTYIPTSGDIRYHSESFGWINLSTSSERTILELRRKEIAYVSQFFQAIPRLTALELVMEPLLRKNGMPYEEAKKIAVELLERLGLQKELFDAYPSTFSGGQQQKINIARAIITKPKLLLLDEPTASLDQKSASVVLELLKELKEEGTAMVGVFHNLEHMKAIADRVYEIP